VLNSCLLGKCIWIVCNKFAAIVGRANTYNPLPSSKGTSSKSELEIVSANKV
jgi:hypothetical protein